MLRFIAKRLGFMLISLVVISIITFSLMHMTPGDFLTIHNRQLAAQGQNTTSNIADAIEAQRRLEERYGLNQPLWKQYLNYMAGAAQFKFGESFAYKPQKIEDLIARSFPISVTLALYSMVVALLIAVPLGILAAVKQNSIWDYLSMLFTMIGGAVPAFVIAVFLVLLVSIKLKLLPTGGWTEPKHMILPVLSLGLFSTAGISRYMRASMLETLRKDYITAAWARGGTFSVVVLGHALRNSLIPLVTVVGPMLASNMVGVVFIEAFFRIPGMGLYFTSAAGNRDYPLLMTGTLFFATVIMVANLLVDIVYGILDPRIRYE